MLRVVCASANPHKVAEMMDLMGGVVEMLPRPQDVPEVIEDADTLLGNARLKANAIMAATRMPALADDTGLFVDSLDGSPGVHTARYAGDGSTDADNRTKLLRELTGKPRTARFVTVALLVMPDKREIVAEGVCEGEIATVERGSRGFGYDPLFIPSDGNGRTFAEMTIEEKHHLSHRGKAFRALAELLRS
jgi:XTP/dITP diphosphohydrolase